MSRRYFHRTRRSSNMFIPLASDSPPPSLARPSIARGRATKLEKPVSGAPNKRACRIPPLPTPAQTHRHPSLSAASFETDSRATAGRPLEIFHSWARVGARPARNSSRNVAKGGRVGLSKLSVSPRRGNPLLFHPLFHLSLCFFYCFNRMHPRGEILLNRERPSAATISP